jgi:acetyl-CoA carboxylase biotin carboxyl carrier protein
LSEKKSGKKRTKKVTSGTVSARMPQGPMDIDMLQTLVDLMSRNDLNTVELRDGEKRIILKRGELMTGVQHVAMAPAMQSPMAAATPAKASESTAAAPVDENAGLVPIKSPMIGTFYAKPSPDAKAFVSVGSSVDEETDVCVIEAMKVFNNIKAETTGTIAKVLVTDGQTVEYGTVLFLVKP